MESDEGMIFYTPQEGDAYLASDSVYLIRTMDPYNRTVINPNLLLLSLKKSTLIEVARKLLPSGQANLYLYGKGGHLITGTGIGTGTQELNLQREEKTIRRSPDTGEDLVSIRVTSAFTGWSMVLEQPLKELRRETDSIKRFAYGIIALSLILAVWISWIVYRGISSPLRKLAYGMKQLRTGNFNIQLADKRVDELGYVIESFNRMAENQRSLIRDHYEKELLLSKVELKFLQSQINPHFLYNTLDSIYWTAKNYEADEISEMVLNLSKFFRLSLSKGREAVSISETIEHLQYYIKVQQLRFLDHFTVRYAVSEESKPYQVLKLLLQPLVENAILHGLEKRNRGGELVIFTMVEGNRLVLGVRDNGIGMNADRLAYIRTELDRASRESSRVPADDRKGKDLFGLRNVAARLAVFYGEEAELVFQSEEGVGTTSLIYLPLEKCLASDLTRPLPATAG
ncbi:sensor histidine kinase [Paenibacillus sp. CC-CFT747]|nr:sensor histidine kinase [Paenibacillus sp. CC-CFT747]